MNRYFQIVIFCFFIYVAICALLYFLQEKLLFFPTKLSADHNFSFENFEEINHKVGSNVAVHSVLFRSRERRGLVFFLHGNAGSVDDWGQGASLYVDRGYDVLYLDYRGYGKSSGQIANEKELVNDVQTVYDFFKNKYTEEKIILSGTSLGTGIAAKIAAQNNPHRLILISPYYSLRSLIKEKVPIVPSFLVKYSLDTYEYLEKVKCPITIFHGSDDDIIPLRHSIDLKKRHEKADLNIIEGYGHNDLSYSAEYLAKMNALLKQ